MKVRITSEQKGSASDPNANAVTQFEKDFENPFSKQEMRYVKPPRPRAKKPIRPSFKERKKSGEMVVTNHRAARGKLVPDTANFAWTRDITFKRPDLWDYGSTERGIITNISIPVPKLTAQYLLETTGVDLLAKDPGFVTQALAKANRASYDALSELGESRETFRLLAGTIHALAHPLKAVNLAIKDMRRKGKMRRITQAAEAWLMYRYGVMPLYLSGKDIMSALEKPIRQYQTTRMGNFQSKNVETTGTTYHSGFGFDAYAESKYKMTETFKWADKLFIKDCLVQDLLTDRIGFDPVVTAWELTRLSFVVDWFVNVGDWLQAMRPPPYQARVSTYAKKVEWELHCEELETRDTYRARRGLSSDVGYTFTYNYNVSAVTGTAFIYHRDVINAGSFLTVPAGDGLNWLRTLDSFALTWPAVRKQILETKKLLGARPTH